MEKQDAPNSNYIATGSVFRHTVETVMLDSFVRQTGIAFIKLDVEGAELLVLRGAHEVLSKSTPPIYLEVNPVFTDRLDYRPVDLFTFLYGYGYRSFHAGDDRFSASRVNDYSVPGDYLFLPAR